MRLFFIRHGETEHNVAGLLAGVTDSRLTNHGVIQAKRLGIHLVEKRQIRFTQIFASDLQRAARTAEAICEANNSLPEEPKLDPICLALLREQDFGSFELMPWNRSNDARQYDPDPADLDFKPKETADAMNLRATTFIQDHVLPLLALDAELEQYVAIVSHGLFLTALWKTLLGYFHMASISVAADVYLPTSVRPLEYLPAWTNTGCLEVAIQEVGTSNQKVEPSSALPDALEASESKLKATLKIIAVNNKDHLINLKRTRGGLGSSVSDDKQRNLDSFFKKPKVAK